MKKLFLLVCMIGAVGAYAQREKAEKYITVYKELAISEMMRTGVPATITLAQGILESQYGESDLAKVSNNHFGIKCKPEWTGSKTYHDDDEKGECFRVYGSVEQSYIDHSDFLKTRSHYAFLFQLDPADYEGWAQGLKKAGYATSKTYPQQLLKVINDYNLQQYSLDALARIRNRSDKLASPANTEMIAVKETSDQTEEIKALPTPDEKKATTTPLVNRMETTVLNTEKQPVPEYPSGIFSINNSKVVFAPAGRSLLSLALQYDLPLNKLFEFNEIPEMDILDADQLLFIERKSKKGIGNIHIVAPGENIHSICQAEGIRLESLLEYNKLGKDAKPAIGDKLLLKPGINLSSASNTKYPGK